MKQLTVRQSEQKGKMFMRKNTDSLRKSASYVDFLEIKTYNIQDRIRMQKSISFFKIRKRGN